jgi:hypothetical protein
MITGFNTDIDCDGQVFHIQTEDKGLTNPVIETLVYTGGQIVCARKSSYARLVTSGRCDENEIQILMETQHRDLIREIRDGSLSKEDLQPFGWNVVSTRPFDEVVRTYLAENLGVEKIRVDLLEPNQLRAGERQTVTLAVIEETSERPIVGAQVIARLCEGETACELFSASTDAAGRIEAACEIPPDPARGATVVCEAEADGKTAELRRRIRRKARASVPSA